MESLGRQGSQGIGPPIVPNGPRPQDA